jgi:hypothetical protein
MGARSWVCFVLSLGLSVRSSLVKNNVPPTVHTPPVLYLPENALLGRANPIVRINATDRDGNVVFFAMASGSAVGDGTNATRPSRLPANTTLFRLEPLTGDVWVPDDLLPSPFSPLDASRGPTVYKLGIRVMNYVITLWPPQAEVLLVLTIHIVPVNVPVIFLPPIDSTVVPWRGRSGLWLYTLPVPEEPNAPFIVNCTFLITSGNDDGTFTITQNGSSFQLFVSDSPSKCNTAMFFLS